MQKLRGEKKRWPNKDLSPSNHRRFRISSLSGSENYEQQLATLFQALPAGDVVVEVISDDKDASEFAFDGGTIPLGANPLSGATVAVRAALTAARPPFCVRAIWQKIEQFFRQLALNKTASRGEGLGGADAHGNVPTPIHGPIKRAGSKSCRNPKAINSLARL